MTMMIKMNINSGLAALCIWLLVAGATAYAAQQPEPYKVAKRYNAAGQLLGEILPVPGNNSNGHPAVRYSYNAQGLVTLVEYGHLAAWEDENKTPHGEWSSFEVNKREHFTYDEIGRKSSAATQNAYGENRTLTEFSYDSRSRLECRAVRMNEMYPEEDSACNLRSSGIWGQDRITHYDYEDDVLDNVEVETRGYRTALQQQYAKYTYEGYLVETVTDANGNKSKFEYDGYGRRKEWWFPSMEKTGAVSTSDYEAYTYDANGNRETLKKRDGRVIVYDYDKLNRVFKKTLPDSPPVFYQYDLRGLQTSASFYSEYGPGVVANQYSGFGEKIGEYTSMSGSYHFINYQYDDNGNRQAITYPDSKTFIYHYNQLDRLIKIEDQYENELIRIDYDRFNRAVAQTTAGGVITGIDYDDISRLEKVDYEFTDPNDNLIANYDYNPASQLVEHTLDNAAYHHQGGAGISGNYLPNRLNQYATVDGITYSHDLNGNLEVNERDFYNYDVENRLINVAGDHNASLHYDPLGRLYKIENYNDNSSSYLLYSGDSLVAEYQQGAGAGDQDGGGQGGVMVKRYLHGGDAGLAPLVGFTGSWTHDAEFYHTNHQGSVIAVSNSNGQVNYINTYDPYGVPGDTNQGRFAYTGQLDLPEINLYHYRARAYDPYTGRFLQTDPVGYEDQMNLYAYVGNDPLNYTDPTGKVKVLSKALKAISDKYGWGECKQCASEMSDAVSQAGESGKRLDARAPGGQNIWSDKYGGNISTNGDHAAVEVDGKVYDNMNGDGVPRAEWEADLHTPSGQLEVNETPIGGGKAGSGSSTMASVMTTVIAVVEVIETVVDPVSAAFSVPEVACATLTPCE